MIIIRTEGGLYLLDQDASRVRYGIKYFEYAAMYVVYLLCINIITFFLTLFTIYQEDKELVLLDKYLEDKKREQEKNEDNEEEVADEDDG